MALEPFPDLKPITEVPVTGRGVTHSPDSGDCRPPALLQLAQPLMLQLPLMSRAETTDRKGNLHPVPDQLFISQDIAGRVLSSAEQDPSHPQARAGLRDTWEWLRAGHHHGQEWFHALAVRAKAGGTDEHWADLGVSPPCLHQSELTINSCRGLEAPGTAPRLSAHSQLSPLQPEKLPQCSQSSAEMGNRSQ